MLSIKKFSPNYSKHAFAGVLVLSLSCQCYKNTWKTFVYTKIVQAFSYHQKLVVLECSTKQNI